MHKNIGRKGLVTGIIVLFVGASIMPSIVGNNSISEVASSNRDIIYVDDDGAYNTSNHDIIDIRSKGDEDANLVNDEISHEIGISNKGINPAGKNKNEGIYKNLNPGEGNANSDFANT